MAEYLQTLTFSVNGYLNCTADRIDNIATRFVPDPSTEVHIDWDPKGSLFAYNAGVSIYTPAGAYYANVSDPITFSATVRLPDPSSDVFNQNLSVIEYYWDFGDGTSAFGNPVTHTYIVPNLNTQVVLRVTDSRGRRTYTRQAMYLISVPHGIILVPAIALPLA